MISLNALLVATLLTPAIIAAPSVGDRAPDFSLRTIDGQTVRLSDAYAKSRVAVVVLRGFPGYQCPLCNRQVQDLVQNAKAFAEADVRVVLVYPGPAQDLGARAAEFVAGKNLPPNFDFVLDPDYAFTNLYGLRWDAPKETAYPSTFLIDRQGKVFFVKISRTHGGRTTAAQLLDVLRRVI